MKMRNKQQQKRFEIYRPLGDLGDPEETGLIANDSDYDLGTPNLKRDEDVIFIGSNTQMKECLLVHLKWRPDSSGRLVSLLSRMELIVGGKVYEFEQLDTYEPSESSLRPGRVTQFGSGSSKLKLYISSPYRRMRLVFNGHMRKRSSGGGEVFVKLSCVMAPLVQVFDFLEQYDEECLKQVYAIRKPVRTINQVVSDLLLHDRHEHKVRISGEYLVVEGDGSRHQSTLALWGFHARHFLNLDSTRLERNIATRRLYAQMENGQSFHIGTRQFDSDQIDFGYTSFEINPRSSPIDKPYKLDWRALESRAQQFELEISGQTVTFSSQATRKQFDDDDDSSKTTHGWYQIETNGKPGWAWVSLDDRVLTTSDENEAIARSRAEYARLEQSGERAMEAIGQTGDCAKLVVSLENEECGLSKVVGSKASSLAQLLKFTRQQAAAESFKVPFAFVLTKAAHDLLISENALLGERIDALRDSVGRGETDNLRDQCKLIEDLLINQEVNLPAAIMDELWAHLEQYYERVDSELASNQVKFAVRSSSWGEDEEDMSAAGQLTTILSVKFERQQLASAIMACYGSKFSLENIEYKRQHGMPLDLPMAVVIQEMIDCHKAGVMFTCDPTTGDESQLIITANYGLGESVVSAQADPDSIVVRVLNQSNLHDVQTVASSEQSSTTTNEELVIGKVTVGAKNVIIGNANDEYDKSKCCLDERQILQLARCGRAISRYFWSQRRDIEWGFMGDQLFLFQSRPVTGLEAYTSEEMLHECDRPSQAELGFYTRANIGEVMPYAITPLTMTYSVFVWNAIGARMFTKFANDFFYAPQCSAEVYHEKYHALFNLRCSILLPLSDQERSVMGKSMEIGFFGREMGTRPELIGASKGFPKKPNPFEGTRFNFYTWPLKMAPIWKIMREKSVLDKLRVDVRARKLALGYEQNKMLGLYNQFRFISRNVYNSWENHIVIIMFATNSNMILTAILSKYIQDPMQLSAATNKFLAISPDVISAEIPERISRMARLVAAQGREQLDEFCQLNSEQALEYLRDNRVVELTKLYEEFLERFGHRCYNEFELSEFVWRERPEQIADMVLKNCLGLQQLSATGDDDALVTPQVRPKTIDEVIKSLNIDSLISLKDKLLIKHVLAPKCQLMLSCREKTKNIIVLYTDILREASRMLAEEMQRQLRIPDKDLFYYLMYDELKPLIREHQPSIVCQAIRRRQMFKRTFSELWKFDEIFSDVTPNHLKPTRELDQAIAQAPRLTGTPASGGKVQAKICLVNNYKELDKVRAGSILLTHSTDIAFSPVFPLIAGIITEVGGLISHGAVVAREYGLPSIIGIPDVTRILQDGEEIILDANNGVIIRLSKGATTGNDQVVNSNGQ